MRVDIRELVLDEETGAHLLDDVPFTGTGCLYYHPSGQVAEASTFVAGRKTGPTRKWYPSGALKSEGRYENDSAEGLFREWHENGRLKREGQFDHSIFTEYQEWDKRGRLVEEYRMQEGDPFHQHLTFLKGLEKLPPPGL
jgi:antitoxin component YwqK of YwqJK toxin-antitoxin module